MQGLHQLPQALPDRGHPHPRRARRHRRRSAASTAASASASAPIKAKKAFSDKPGRSFADFKWKIALPAPVAVRAVRQPGRHRLCPSGAARLRLRRRVRGCARGGAGQRRTRGAISGGRVSAGRSSVRPAPWWCGSSRVRFPFLLRQRAAAAAPDGNRGGCWRARQARERNPGLRDEDIGICFISPCPAKVSYVKNSFMGKKSNVDLVVSMNDVYFALLPLMKKDKTPMPISHSGMIGISWASAGGEASRAVQRSVPRRGRHRERHPGARPD